jgi:hypothetical protein
MEIARKKKRNG